MRLLILTCIIFSLATMTSAQVNLEVEGEAKITVARLTTSSDKNIVRLSNGNLAIRQYRVGDFAQGGIVFWVDESGEHGLVCAKSDQSIDIRWHAGFLGSTHAKGDGPLAGEMNTAIIISGLLAYGDDGNLSAARICAELKVTEGGKTYGDWYLPSKEELHLLYQNMEEINSTALSNNGSSFQQDYYWSSTEDNLNNAWTFDFRTNSPTSGQFVSWIKSSTHRVRAIRAF